MRSHIGKERGAALASMEEMPTIACVIELKDTRNLIIVCRRGRGSYI